MESPPAAVVCKFDDFICTKTTWLYQFYSLLGYYVYYYVIIFQTLALSYMTGTIAR